MPTAAELFDKRISRLESIPDLYIKRVGASQQSLFNELMVILARLDLDGGVVELTSENLLRIDVLMNEYYKELKEGRYGKIVGKFIKDMEQQRVISELYNVKEFGGFKVRTPDMVFRQSQKSAVKLLLGDDFKTNFINVIRNEVISNVEGRATFKEMRTNLSVLFKDAERLPLMQSWTNQVSRDIFAIADRSYNNEVGNELGLEFGEYAGGLVRDSRKFCVDRVGRFFHVEELKDMASLTWQGKFRRTTRQNMLIWMGGYNCDHVFAWRSTSSVPKIDLQRNIDNGNFTPTKKEAELLGI